MTVQQIVYDMTGTFTNGQAYVALSRATKLKGLYLKNYNPKLIYRAENVHKALQKMEEFRSEKDEHQKHGTFEIIHHNVQGLRSKMNDILANKDLTCADALALTETWLCNDVSSETIQLPAKQIYRKDRRDGKGGTCVYASDETVSERLTLNNTLEHCAVKLTKPNKPPLLLLCMYRSPQLKVRQYIPLLQDLLHVIRNSGTSNIIVAGDFNEDQLKDMPHPIKTTFAEYGFKQLVTNRTTTYGSMLDLVFVRLPNYSAKASVMQTYYSDHELVKTVCCLNNYWKMLQKLIRDRNRATIIVTKLHCTVT